MFHFLPFFFPSNPQNKQTLLPFSSVSFISRTKPILLFHSYVLLHFENFTKIDMSSGRGSSTGSRITEDEVNELISKLQSLLPDARRRNLSRGSTSKLLKETCNYIKSLHREVDDLSDRLSDLMSTMDSDTDQAQIIRSLMSYFNS